MGLILTGSVVSGPAATSRHYRFSMPSSMGEA